MRRLKAFRAAAVLIVALATCQVSPVSAEIDESQWTAYSAQEFAEAAAPALKSAELTDADKAALSKLAWNRFLADESFVGGGEIATVQSLVKQFAGRRSAAVDETTSAEEVEARFAALREQLTQRLRENRSELGATGLYGLNDLTKALGMASSGSLEKAELFVNWMSSNDWRSLPLTDRYNLYGFINADAVDRRKLSARWTGTLTAPTAGRYILRQAPQYSGTDCRVKLYFDEQLVLDSSDPAQGEGRFESEPIELAAGQRLAIRVEMRHEVSRIDWSEGAPMVLVSWQINDTPLEIIPSSAFTPPEGFAEAGAHGLKGEYFGDTELSELKATRLDRALDLVSSWPPAIAVHHEQADAVFRTCVDDVLNDVVLAEAGAEGNEEFFHFSLWRIAYRMSGTDRVKLVEALLRTPEAVKTMTPEAMGRLMQAVYMLPAKEHLTLFGEWATLRPHPRTQAGFFPGWGIGYYQEVNTDYYWLMGHFWQRSYWPDADYLWNQSLVRENGDCNLAVLFASAFAAQKNDASESLLQLIDDHIADANASNDQKASWRIARAWAAGAIHGAPQPMAGFNDLEAAFEQAESGDYRFWALEEMTARLSSIDQGQRAKDLIESNRSLFQSPEQIVAMDRWAEAADSLSEKYAQHRDRAKVNARASYAKELERRRQLATARGDDSAAGRLEQLIDRAETLTK